MTKVLVLIIAVLFIASLLPALEAKAGEKSVFQLVSDSMDKPVSIADKDKLKTGGEIKIFQSASDAIKEGAKKARNQSLRGKK